MLGGYGLLVGGEVLEEGPGFEEFSQNEQHLYIEEIIFLELRAAFAYLLLTPYHLYHILSAHRVVFAVHHQVELTFELVELNAELEEFIPLL